MGAQPGLGVRDVLSVVIVYKKSLGLLVLLVGLSNDAMVDDVLQLLVAEGNDGILRLEIGVNDFANTMQVVEANQNLSGHSPYQGKRNAFVVIPLHDFEEVDAQNLKDHDEVVSVGSVVHE